jgi:DNA-binding transcriptional regulator YhcF (GntR family)
MLLSNNGAGKNIAGVTHSDPKRGLGRTRLARELFSGRFRPGESLQVERIATEHGMNNESVLEAFAEFQALGMIKLAGGFSAIVRSPDHKDMQDAYEVRAALEEIAARTAAVVLKGNIGELLDELGAMRAAVYDGNIDACIEHDINGDILVAYTDGITEVENRQGEFWGDRKLAELLSSCSQCAPQEIIARILDRASIFADGLPQRDDMTLMVMPVQND